MTFLRTFEHKFDYKIIYSAKKNLSLQIKNKELIVRAPLKMTIVEIEKFIAQKQKLIIKHLQKQQLQLKQTYNDNDLFLYFGKLYPLIKRNCPLYFNGKNFIGNANRESFLDFYKNNFIDILEQRLPFLAKQNNFVYNQVRVKMQKTLWGSCSSVNNLNFNFLLAMAPIKTIDSVIIHELCHTIHKNHSKDFWHLVYTIMPDYKLNHQFLKDNYQKISIFG